MKTNFLTTALFIICTYSSNAQYSVMNPLKMYDYKVTEEDRQKLAELSEMDLPKVIDPAIAYAYVLNFQDTINKIDTAISSLLDESYEETDFDNLNDVNNQILEFRKRRKELLKYRDFFESINSLTGTPTIWRSFFPLRTHAQTEFYYTNVRNKSFEVLNNVVIQGSADNAIVATEVITGYFSVLRCNLSSVIYSSGGGDTSEALVNKIYNGGGLLNANISYPLFFRIWKEAAITWDLNFKASSDFNAFGTEIPKDDFIGYLEPSFNVYGEFILRNTDLSIFVNYKLGAVYASNALDSQIGNEGGKPFGVSQIYCGINFNKRIKLSTNIPLRNIEGLGGSDNFTVGIQFFPDM